jgi:hypothetical protein
MGVSLLVIPAKNMQRACNSRSKLPMYLDLQATSGLRNLHSKVKNCSVLFGSAALDRGLVQGLFLPIKEISCDRH